MADGGFGFPIHSNFELLKFRSPLAGFSVNWRKCCWPLPVMSGLELPGASPFSGALGQHHGALVQTAWVGVVQWWGAAARVAVLPQPFKQTLARR